MSLLACPVVRKVLYSMKCFYIHIIYRFDKDSPGSSKRDEPWRCTLYQTFTCVVHVTSRGGFL